jgi:hypothetical protein
MIEIVHASAAKRPVGNRKPRRLDDMGFNAKASAEPENGAGILGNVGLIKRDPHRLDDLQQAQGHLGGPVPFLARRRPHATFGRPAIAGLRSQNKGANRSLRVLRCTLLFPRAGVGVPRVMRFRQFPFEGRLTVFER